MKILLIEDDKDIIEYITIALEMGHKDISLFTSMDGKRGLEILETQQPDLVMLDLMLPDMDGFNLLKSIKLSSNTPVIIITARASEIDIVKGLMLGADEYIIKPFGQMEIIARIMAVVRSHKSNALDDIIRGDIRFNAFKSTISFYDKVISLSRTEALIINELFNKDEQVTTYEEIGQALWGESYPGMQNAIRVYIMRLRTKLSQASSGKVLIRTKPGIGYYLSLNS
ncbi:response regulator transcription factor [Dehalococcoides mccartyi]|uniref:DNA-binding response regulator n=1 Tax=Dehalococcoides mccartyi (strain VS) TaxID=311424 RepID=D2BG08_DEHMV|nr:response regulator transcription factor [Dehalococcoides mccartyi]ACZ61258.1 DNA-binding response regulator [Dehalococcoides mccartyi VS]